MTHSGGKPHQVGDRNQRYEVSYLEKFKGERKIMGWTEDKVQAQAMCRAVNAHPVWSQPVIRDRHPDLH